MAIEPWVFLCYGGCDREAAYALAHEFWKNQVECYNYRAKPVEDRLGTELDHRNFLMGCRLFVALLTPESTRRDLVVEELALAAQVARASGGLFCQTRVYIGTPALREGTFPAPDRHFGADRLTDVPGLVRELLDRMGPGFAGRAREAWAVNRGLYPDAWEALNTEYSPAPQPVPPTFTPGRHSIFGDEREPTLAELKSLGRTRLNRLWQDVAKRRQRLRSPSDGGESFLEWSLRRDRELIEAALQTLDAVDLEGGSSSERTT